MSMRGLSDSRKSSRVGRADCCNRRHWSTGTSTAASAPRFVTTCGPSRRHVSRNSLNRAFASWTGQMVIVASIIKPSHITSLSGHSSKLLRQFNVMFESAAKLWCAASPPSPNSRNQVTGAAPYKDAPHSPPQTPRHARRSSAPPRRSACRARRFEHLAVRTRAQQRDIIGGVVLARPRIGFMRRRAE